MSASRKLYVALAKEFKRSMPVQRSDERSSEFNARYAQWHQMVHATAGVLKEDNSGFVTMTFLQASGADVGAGR